MAVSEREMTVPGEEHLPAILSAHKRDRGQLIPILQDIQARLGYLPESAMREVAEYLGISESNVFGVASFYAQFRFKPVGRKQIHVCRGTACHVRGADKVLGDIKTHLGIEEGETTPDGEYTLETVACIGTCGLAPCITVEHHVHGRLTPKDAVKLIPVAKEDGDDGR